MVGSVVSLFLEISKKVKDVSQSSTSMVSLSPPKSSQDKVFFRQLNALDDLYVNKDNEKFLRVNESLNQDHRRVSLPEPFQEDSQSAKININEGKNEDKRVKVHSDKKINHLKVMFPKLSRFLSASDRVLYKQTHRKEDDSILSKRHSDVMSHSDDVADEKKVTELRKSSIESSVSSCSSGAETKIGFEVISDKKRRVYYFNESIDSAEDALHTIEEDASLPIVVVHPSDKKLLYRGNSFSDSACSPSLPGDLLVKRGNILRNYPHDKLNSNAHHKHHNDNNRSTVHSGPEIINGVSGSDVENVTKRSSKKEKPPKNEKKKKTSSWYNVLSPSYKSRSEDFKRIFKDLPAQERLLVEYSCALQKDILIQGRMYVSQSWICFYANIFRWETVVMVKCCDVIKLTKEKTARVIPNAIQISTKEDKYFFASFGARDKVFKQLELVRRNAQMGVVMNRAEFWSWVHLYYGDDLGLTSDDDDDYEPLTTEDRSKFQILLNTELDATVSLVEEATEAAVVFATHLGRPEEKVQEETETEEKKEEVPPEDVIDESSDEEIVDYCSQHRHNSIEVLDEAYNIPVDSMFNHIFGDSVIFREFAKSNKMIDLKLNEWRTVNEEDEEEEEEIKVVDGDVVEKGKVGKKREISYTLLLNLNFGPKQSPSREKQVMYADSEPGQFYLIDSDCFNDNIPYGENFFISNRYCISRLSNNRSRLKITSQIKYKKSVWGFVKNFLAKNVTGGINSTFSILADLLRLESDRGLLLTSRDDPVSDPFHRHLTSPQSDVTDHVAPCKTNQTSSKRRHGDKEVTYIQEGRRTSVDERTPTLDTIIKALLLLMLVLLFFNGIFFYKLWNLELIASRLIKNHVQQTTGYRTSDHHLHHTSGHNNLYTNELHSHSTLEQMVKDQLKNGESILTSDWLNNLDRKDSENDVWSSVRRKQYQRLLGNTLKLMESMRVTMEQLQKQLGISEGVTHKNSCDKRDSVGANNACIE